MGKRKNLQQSSLATREKKTGLVRIGSGKWKRTPLPVMDLEGLRPTGSRIRETVFDWMRFLLGDFSGKKALDMFAGSGALGLEFASRGGSAVLIEKDRRNATALSEVVRRLHALSEVSVVCGDSLSACQRWPDGNFDVIFIDPPFSSGLHEPALQAVRRLLTPGGLVYYETPAELEEPLPSGWRALRQGVSGAVDYRILSRAPEAEEGESK